MASRINVKKTFTRPMARTMMYLCYSSFASISLVTWSGTSKISKAQVGKFDDHQQNNPTGMADL